MSKNIKSTERQTGKVRKATGKKQLSTIKSPAKRILLNSSLESKGGMLYKEFKGLIRQQKEPKSLLYGGITSDVKVLPQNIIMWFYDEAPLHYMHKRFGLGFCLSGGCTIGIDTNKFILKPDTGILIFPFQTHYYIPPENGKMINLAISFSVDNTSDKSLEPLRNKVFSLTEEDGRIVSEMVNMGLGESAVKSEVAHILSRFICRKLEEQKLVVEPSLENKLLNSKYERIVRYIRKNISAPLSIKDISKAENISIPHLQRIFKEHTGGLTLGQFIRNLRIKQAHELLIHSEQNIAEIAESCGFSDQFVFSRAFKRLAGTSPINYRKEFKNH